MPLCMLSWSNRQGCLSTPSCWYPLHSQASFPRGHTTLVNLDRHHQTAQADPWPKRSLSASLSGAAPASHTACTPTAAAQRGGRSGCTPGRGRCPDGTPTGEGCRSRWTLSGFPLGSSPRSSAAVRTGDSQISASTNVGDGLLHERQVQQRVDLLGRRQHQCPWNMLQCSASGKGMG